MKFFTRENITLFLSIFGSAGTIITWIITFIKTRKNLAFKIIKLCKNGDQLILYASIINRSSLPISIESISLKYNSDMFSCLQMPTRIFTKTSKTGSEVTNVNDFFTLQFPINLTSLSGVSGYFSFDIPQETLQQLSSPLTVLISTNRGTVVEKKLEYTTETNWVEML